MNTNNTADNCCGQCKYWGDQKTVAEVTKLRLTNNENLSYVRAECHLPKMHKAIFRYRLQMGTICRGYEPRT